MRYILKRVKWKYLGKIKRNNRKKNLSARARQGNEK